MGGDYPRRLEGPRARGWDIEIEHSVQRVDHLSDVQRRRVARVVQVLTGLSGIAMVGQAHLIPQRSASLHVLTQPHLGRQLAARPALLQEDLLAARCRRGVEEVVVAKVFCLPGRKARARGPAQDGWARERAAEQRAEEVVLSALRVELASADRPPPGSKNV